MTAVALEFAIPVEHVLVFKPVFDVGESLAVSLLTLLPLPHTHTNTLIAPYCPSLAPAKTMCQPSPRPARSLGRCRPPLRTAHCTHVHPPPLIDNPFPPTPSAPSRGCNVGVLHAWSASSGHCFT